MTVTVTLADLLQAPTESELVTLSINALTANAFPATSWDDVSFARVSLQGNAAADVELGKLGPLIAAGGYLQLAEDDWLTLFAQSQYDETRQSATFAQRQIRLTDAGAAPHTYAVGTVWVANDAGLRFVNITGGTLGVAGTLDLTFQAESGGSTYNGSTVSWTAVTSLPGVALSDTPAGVVTLGADEQSDTALVAACTEKWSTLGTGANDDAYKYNATHVAGVLNVVTRVRVNRHTPLPGQVTLRIAGATVSGSTGDDSLSAPVVALVLAGITPPNCVDLFVSSAKVTVITLTGTVYFAAAEFDVAKAAAIAALIAWEKEIEIGASVSRELLLSKLLSGAKNDAKTDASLSAPSADVTLGADRIPVFNTAGITWTAV